MAFYTYILRSQKTGRLYIGQAKDCQKRLREHNSGQTKSTSTGIPWEILYAKSFETRLEARQTLLEYYKYCQMSEDGYYEQKGKTKWYFIDKMEEESTAISSVLSKVTVVDKEGNDSLKP